MSAPMTRVFGRVALFTIGALGVACGAPSEVTSEWRDPSTVAPRAQKVVVLAENTTPATRHAVEDRFVAELTERGVNAVPSYRAMGEVLPAETDAARVALAERGYDSALVIHIGRGETVVYDRTVPVGYYGYGPMAITDDTVTDTSVTSHAALWDLGRAKAVWRATATTTNPTSGDSIGKSLAKKLVPELADDGIVPQKK